MRSVLSECLLVLPPLLLHTRDGVRQSQLRGGLRQQVRLLLLLLLLLGNTGVHLHFRSIRFLDCDICIFDCSEDGVRLAN